MPATSTGSSASSALCPAASTWSSFYYANNIDSQPASVANLKTAGAGIEQPVWDDKTHLFYQAIPGCQTGPTCPAPNTPAAAAAVGRVDALTATGVHVKRFTAAGCDDGPTGPTLTDKEQLIGACGNGGLVMDIRGGSVRKIIPNVGGGDEVWFNPGGWNALFRDFYARLLGVVDASSLKVVTTSLVTQSGSHSVAAYAGNPNQILVPLTNNGIKVFVSGGRGNGGGDH